LVTTPREGAAIVQADAGNARSVAILGGGNLGQALARGWVRLGQISPTDIAVTRRQAEKLSELAEAGFSVGSDNVEAVRRSRTVLVAVQPQQLAPLLAEIRGALEVSRHHLISVVSGVSIDQITQMIGKPCSVVRAMPNTAVAIGESMTCLAVSEGNGEALPVAQQLFDLLGRTLVVPEEMMIPATALCACGVAFFLRSVRAASQGGMEIGFHPEEALLLAAQTAKGAASLLLTEGDHPESQIDRVTTPRGCTIAGLNEMEHQGFSSAMIKGILVSADKARSLY
jgi:pyrroline-5-carboxylate reductase